MRPPAVYDTECYPNYWLLKFRPIGGICFTFELIGQDASFTPEQCQQILGLFRLFTTVSFNGNGYDVALITAATNGYTVTTLKWLNDEIILRNMRPWELNIPEWKPDDHIDVMEVAPGEGGMKFKAARVHTKTLRDLPHSPDKHLTREEMREVDAYCEIDLQDCEDLYVALKPQLDLRIALGQRYGLDLRSKSDAQVAEAVLKERCQQRVGHRLYRAEVQPGTMFRYKFPAFLAFSSPTMLHAQQVVADTVFTINHHGRIELPPQLKDLVISIGDGRYQMGIGGLHSQESKLVCKTNDTHVLLMADVASYYPNLIINSGEYPPSLGESFTLEYQSILDERLDAKARQKTLPKNSAEWIAMFTINEGGKIMVNGAFGKTGSPYSILYAPTMLIQTTITGQLSLLMLIEWLQNYGAPVVSANTDGIAIYTPREKEAGVRWLIAEWEKRSRLTMEVDEFVALYARDVNNYFAVKAADDVKRKGEYAPTSLILKKSPDCEICADAAAAFLARGESIEQNILACRDIRKFVTAQKVAGGAVKLWGEGPRKDAKVADMVPVLTANGWTKEGRGWRRGDVVAKSRDAYESCFAKQTPEYLGKVARWYYSTRSPGPIVYATNGNTVSLSYGAMPAMTLPDEFPTDVDYMWYIDRAKRMLSDCGYQG